MTAVEERVAEHGAELSALKHEMSDAWKAIHKAADSVVDLGKQVATLVLLSKQPHQKEQCLTFTRVESLEARVDSLESDRDKVKGGWGALHWILTTGIGVLVLMVGWLIWFVQQLPKGVHP